MQRAAAVSKGDRRTMGLRMTQQSRGDSPLVQDTLRCSRGVIVGSPERTYTTYMLDCPVCGRCHSHILAIMRSP